MRKPYFNEEERQLIYFGTMAGDSMLLKLSWLHFKKAISETYIIKFVLIILNKLYNKTNP